MGYEWVDPQVGDEEEGVFGVFGVRPLGVPFYSFIGGRR